MASVIQVGNKFRAQVRRAGQKPLTKTFPNKETPCKTLAEAEKAAKKWAMEQEVAINAGKKVGVHGKVGVTFSQAVDRYVEENPVMSVSTSYIFGYLKEGLGTIHLEKMTSNDIFNYIKNKNFSPVSGASHFSFFRSVINMAQIVWEYHVPDILGEAQKKLKHKKLIGKSKERERRPTTEEIQMLLQYDYKNALPMADIIEFAMSSAMRQAEITRIEHTTMRLKKEHDNGIGGTIVITDRKHPTKKIGNHQTVPLLDKSIEIIQRQPRKEGDDRVFPFTANYVGQTFTKACKDLGIVDLHFHDLRHEATNRLFEMGYDIEEVVLFTGHEDWKMLRRYTHLKAKDIRRIEPAKAEPATVQTGGIVMDAATLEQFKMFQTMQAMMAQQKAA